MELKRGQFKINHQHSEQCNVYMRERPKRPSAARVIEMRERPGNDSIVMDFKYYKNAEQTISCYAKAVNLEEVSVLEEEISYWLDMGSYTDYTVYYDPHYIYQAIVTSSPEFTGQRRNGNLIPFDFSISLRPFKMSRVGLSWKTNKKILINTEKYPSKPKIHIFGSGDISFSINDQVFELKGVDEEILIDSAIEESYKKVKGEIVPQDEKTLFRDYPLLNTGRNKISWTGDVQKIQIMPRWWTKI
ncbi:phage tail protein [Enterococcus wangshanyuanii]|uniref:Tail protein n=1 Tax=Enterococcus wangshanyuanii TaxID=2005703 RepID=A0ABQ1PWC9_9ENTE|nr:phage tail protein [Enterococcus wangshanyuanii]GGD05079.1 tail protein [Enterococcus wangshanyuanii]